MSGQRSCFAWVVVTLLVVALLVPATALAIEIREGDSVSVARGEIVSDDLYAFGNSVTIDGTVDGDVIAFGQIVVIGGDVRGSVMGAAQAVRIDGNVDGSVRAAGATVDVDGRVGGDVLAGANRVSVAADVARDLAAGGQSVRISGTVGRNVLVGAESLVIDGSVGGDVEAQTTRVVVGSQGSVDGDLDYWSEREADVQGDVTGTATRHEPAVKERRSVSPAIGILNGILGAILAWVQSIVGFVLLGLVMVFAMRHPTDRGSRAAIVRVWLSLGVGLLVFFGTPMAAGFVFVVGLFIGAWWLSFVLLAVYWLLLLAGVVLGSLAVGRAILGKASSGREPALAWSLLLGILLVWVVAVIPVLGWLAAWAVMLTGAGALVLTWLGKDARPEAPAVTAPGPVAPPAMTPPVAPPLAG
jgi:cytoskeletal protein CcmA (bactofilin family)